MNNPSEKFTALYEVIKQLRAPDGCPWDREQTPLSLRSTLLEETYEALEAIEETEIKNQSSLHAAEELGDILLNVVMIAYMYEQREDFSVADMLQVLTEKLIRRHPHVFGQTAGFAGQTDNAKPVTADKVLDQWEEIKKTLENKREESLLDSIPKNFPPLLRAFKLQKKASKNGFDWNDYSGAFSKFEEECAEFKESIEENNQNHIEEEFGDVLFSLVNIARFLKIDPAVALSRSNTKFESRFRFIEKKMNAENLKMTAENCKIMDKFWEEAKTNTNE
ncbi:nucleoside triphosphate pyrophosphohydrolase [Treponema phagedenis]|uniref:Nucleoside triphosphate pyrophosphohydrolase n=1 Tax=Treponema phagedenis TaxID=162 RepID=A0AAE6IWR3_TREPH|nr:nucleoside triphosphate pyrophosphohydrolase [Treponema phagedenis]QEJ99415.1 nucleoside triphosphate pyrophosphohydrolase [Treponema phagedenis]